MKALFSGTIELDDAFRSSGILNWQGLGCQKAYVEIIESPPQQRTIKYLNENSLVEANKECTFFINFPYVQYTAVTLLDVPEQYHATINLISCSFESASEKTELKTLPLFNIYSYGVVCVGDRKAFSRAREFAGFFWQSRFNLEITGSVVITKKYNKIVKNDLTFLKLLQEGKVNYAPLNLSCIFTNTILKNK
jgi:hypothetical protein